METGSPAWPEPDADERTTLTGYLDAYRTVVLRKVSGLTADQLSTPLRPSSMTLGGLLKHLAVVEDDWFAHDFAGRAMPEPWLSVDWDADRDWEWHSAAEDSPEELVALFEAACNRSRSVVAGADSLDGLSVGTRRDGRHWNLRWILVHMIEEYARHAGHADLLREAIDGATGD